MRTLKTTIGSLVGATALLLALVAPVGAQQILLDQPVRAGELTLFPDLNDAMVYYYVSDKPKLAVGANSRPQFSFLRYVENVRSAAGQPEAREGEGGGIVHALVSLSVSREQITEAQRELQRTKPGARIQGPVIYKSGKFGLVSSFKEADGRVTTRVVGLGNAPILDGEKAAVSIMLTKLGAKILWESFKTPTPDISFTFEMDMAGFRSPHRAVIEANFDQIYEHTGFSAGIASAYLAAEIRAAFDDLVRQGAIKVTQVGGDERMEALITTAYNKISDMMFSPLNGTGTPSIESLTGTAGGGTSVLDRASTMVARNREEARSDRDRARAERREDEARATPATPPAGDPPAGAGGAGGSAGTESGSRLAPVHARTAGVRHPTERSAGAGQGASTSGGGGGASFAIVAAFEMRRVRQRGTFRIDLNKYTADSMTLRFDENIGDLRSLMADAEHFREVNLEDPLYQQREVLAFVDGANAGDFGQYINFVTVRLRKKHASAQETLDEVRIDRTNFNAEGNKFALMYGWKGDNDRRRWLNYDYQATWSFFGGRTVEQGWLSSTSGAIGLAPPYRRHSVEVQADAAAVAAAGIRAITVKVFYDLGAGEQVKQATLNPAKSQLSQQIEFMLPSDRLQYAYEVTWRLGGNRTVSSGRQASSESILFVDEPPAS
jgi:hypothetical protein